jgi:FtsP/CotA-like multicopper oxidase with cupredoxin domain
MEVEPRKYRLRLLNGCDSRYLVIQFFEVPAGDVGFGNAFTQVDFTVIGGDQGLASAPTLQDTQILEPGARGDIIVDFASVKPGNRVIMKNIAGDAPFGGEYGEGLGPGDLFEDRQTDRIMAFDVVLDFDDSIPDPSGTPKLDYFGPKIPSPTRVRKLALFEGTDEYGRLQPLLGTAEPATDYEGNPINWPDTDPYRDAGLVGQIVGTIGWHSPTTENPALGDTEEWEIWNVSVDAHPINVHLVNFEIIGRQEIVWDSHTTGMDMGGDRILVPGEEAGDGTYLVEQPVVQHNGALGKGFRLENLTYGPEVKVPDIYVENFPRDTVAAFPGVITRIKATFPKPGHFVW